MRFMLPELPFMMSGLEPFISRNTLELHYWKYHMSYISNLNNLISGTKFENIDLETIVKVSDGPVYNNASQAWNHSFYFACLNPDNTGLKKGSLNDIIKHSFGSLSSLKNIFSDSAYSLFGFGWIWLILNSRGSLEIIQESNAGNPLRRGLTPLLNCDLWEHAYFLDYKDRRQDYIKSFWKLIDWTLVEKRYDTALSEQKII
jgi:superoxide dismutase, Fe-Mn family